MRTPALDAISRDVRARDDEDEDAPVWEVELMNAGPRWSGHPAFKKVRVRAWTGAAAEERAAAQMTTPGWRVSTRSTKNLGRGASP